MQNTNELQKIKEIKKAFTHSGKFHADDVFSAALLTYVNPGIEIERALQIPENYEGIVFDIGLGEYDHHQADQRVRENGIPYAAFGLLWEKLGNEILGEEEAVRFDEEFVQKLDLADNTGSESEIAKIISWFNPTWDSDEPEDDAFEEAKICALKILTGKFNYVKSIQRAGDIVLEALEQAQENIVILPVSLPWKHYLKETEMEFVIFPSQRGGYCAQGVPDEEESGDLKCPFPEEWRGKSQEELKELTGIETLKFCHNSGFLLASDTVPDAVKACKLAKKLQKGL